MQWLIKEYHLLLKWVCIDFSDGFFVNFFRFSMMLKGFTLILLQLSAL